MTWVDHSLALCLLVYFPAWSAWGLPRWVERIESGLAGARTKGYVSSVVSMWSFTVMLLAHWSIQSRELDTLGLRWPAGAALWISLCISLAAMVFFTAQTLAITRSADARAKLRQQAGAYTSVAALLPRTLGEARAFTAVSVTAGICEEVQYRGYLLWYIAGFVDRPLAVAAAIVAFGVAHAYQGWRGVLRAGLAGAILMALYLITGSLLAPMVLHAAVDISSGRSGRHAFTDSDPPEGPLRSPSASAR